MSSVPIEKKNYLKLFNSFVLNKKNDIDLVVHHPKIICFLFSLNQFK